MILVLLFLVVCIAYYLYIKNYRYLSFGLGCLFFLWYGWYSSYSVFTFTHEPIIITSTTSQSSSINNSNNNNSQLVPQQISKQHGFHTYPTTNITIDATKTNIQSTDMPQIILNKNRITVNSNMDKLGVSTWAQSLNASGLWSDIDYTSGCSASTVSWLAKTHLERIESMASVWYHHKEDTTLLSKIKQSLDYWFLHDFDEEDCFMYGGRAYKNCPCGTPGLWTQAWRSQAIDIPRHIGNICLLIYQQLLPEQQFQCIKFTSRSYSLINQYDGLNRLKMAYNGGSLALLKGDTLLLQDALDHVENNTAFMTTTTTTNGDGIQVDGSYLYNNGQLDNGYHGESYLLDLVTMFDMMILDSNTTSWLPSNTTQTAFVTLISGSEWMMIGTSNSTTQSRWLWQHFSTLSQLALDPPTTTTAAATITNKTTRSVSLNITQLDTVLQHWSLSTIPSTNTTNTTINTTVLGLGSTFTRLNNTYTSANQGPLIGTRYFWKADYLVHRCHGFVTTLKMSSPRTRTSSTCTNNYDASIMTYQQGTDYLNAFGDGHAWDWNHVPGTTVKSNTSATCNNNNNNNNNQGSEHAFVGATVLEQNQMGVAVMNFTANDDDAFGWQKTFFFFPSVYAIQLELLTTTTTTTTDAANTSALTATTTLDQRRQRGDIYLNGKRLRQQPPPTKGIQHQDVKTLWHDKMLYSFETPVNLTMMMNDGNGNGDDLWTASVTAASSLIYTVQPNYGVHRHQTHPPLEFINTQEGVRGAFSASDHALALAFWSPASINVPWSHSDDGDDGVDVFIETYAPLTVFLQQQVGNGTWIASISDPTQSLVSTSIQISIDQEEAPIQYDIDFPQGHMLGSSVMIVLQDEP